MKTSQTLLVPYSAADMFDLVDNVERYPEFLPWCAGTTLVERTDTLTVGTIRVNWLGARFTFTTRNPKQRPDWMRIALQSGPFSELNGEWHFTSLGDAGCKISLDLSYRFTNALLGIIAAPVFGRIASTMADAFVSRARVLAASGQFHRPPVTSIVPSASPSLSSFSPAGADHE